MSFWIKVIFSAIMVAVIAEVGKRSSFAAAILASLHVTTLLALVWLYIDTKDTERVATVAQNTFWLIIPSLSFFITLPWLLRQGFSFSLSLTIAVVASAVCFLAFVWILKQTGVNLS